MTAAMGPCEKCLAVVSHLLWRGNLHVCPRCAVELDEAEKRLLDLIQQPPKPKLMQLHLHLLPCPREDQ